MFQQLQFISHPCLDGSWPSELLSYFLITEGDIWQYMCKKKSLSAKAKEIKSPMFIIFYRGTIMSSCIILLLKCSILFSVPSTALSSVSLSCKFAILCSPVLFCVAPNARFVIIENYKPWKNILISPCLASSVYG